MKAFIITIRSHLNERKINYYITRFLDKGVFKARYIEVHLEFNTDLGESVSIGENFLLDIEDPGELKRYKHYIANNYKQFKSNSDKANVIKKIVFNYNKVSRKDYINKGVNFSS